MYSAISRSIFSIGGKIVLLREKLVVRFTFHGQIENEEKRLFPKGRIIIVIVHVSSSCALVVVFLEGKRKKKKRKTSARERAVSRDNGGYLWIQITVYRRLEFLIKKQRGRLRTGRCPMPGVNEHEITSVTPCEKWRCRRSFYPRPLNSSFHALKFSLSFLSPPPPFLLLLFRSRWIGGQMRPWEVSSEFALTRRIEFGSKRLRMYDGLSVIREIN